MLEAIKKDKYLQALIIVVLFASVIRLIGITHGFPFIFHPDEPAVVRSATGIRFDPNPAHFDWPHLHFYLNYFLYFLFIKFRGFLQILKLRSFLSGYFPLLWRDPLVFYFLSRVFDALLGAFTAIPIYFAGKTLFDKRVGLFSALAIAFVPFHVHTSHFALIDVPAAFWISWVIFFSSLIYTRKNTKDYILAGFFVGLAASTKYHGGLAAIIVPLAHIFRVLNSKNEKLADFDGIKLLVLSGIFSVAGFVVGTPYSVLDVKTFLGSKDPTGALWQFANVGSVTFSEQVSQFVAALSYKFADSFGYTFIGVYLCFIFYALNKRDKRYWLVLLPSLFLFFYISGFEKFRSHYFIPTYPFVALAVGIVVGSLIKSKILRNLFMLLIFLVPMWLSVQRSIILARKDTRVILFEWLEENVTLFDYLVYNSSTVLPVVEKISKDRATKGIKEENLVGKSGYIIVYDGDRLEDHERVLFISSYNRRGSKVDVYSF